MMVRPKSPLRLEWANPAVCSLDYRLKLVGRLPFFKHLPADVVSKINGLFHDRDVSADECIYFEGDDATHLYMVATGKVKLTRAGISGREVLLDILRSGEYFGSLTIFGERIHAETHDFELILSDHPDVTRKVLEAVGQRLAESQEIVKQLSTYTAEQRIASALLRLAHKLGEAHGTNVLIQLPFSRQDLAAMTASTTETVSRVMSRFAEQGWIKTGRKWVTIANPKQLEELTK
jgi:CRP-like cAMP-binding protein